MQDRPDAVSLLEAIQDLLMKEIMPAIKENEALSYKTLVSWNMLGVIGREFKQGEVLLDKEAERVLSILKENSVNAANYDNSNPYLKKQEIVRELNSKLSELIKTKKISDPNSKIWLSVKESIKEKLEISNPRFGTEG